MKHLTALLFALVLVLTLASGAQAQPIWTAVANTGAIDEASLGIFSFATDGFGSPAALRYLPASASLNRVIARYNVTNPDEANLVLPWTTLQLGFTDTGATMQVQAALMRVNACNGVATPVCVVTSFNNATPTCNVCTFAAGTVNFGPFLYYVEVILSRSAAAAQPAAHTLRIF